MRASVRSLCAVLALLPAACSLRQQPPPGSSGEVIYRLQNCANCHGPSGEGSWRAPPLRELGKHWSRDALAEFLADPQAVVAGDQRLRGMQEQYGGNKMGPYDNLDRELRATLAAWLLASFDTP